MQKHQLNVLIPESLYAAWNHLSQSSWWGCNDILMGEAMASQEFLIFSQHISTDENCECNIYTNCSSL